MNGVRSYRSLFLGDGNPHQQYYGWVVAEDMPGLRVLRKRHGAITRHLALLSSAGLQALPEAVGRAKGRLGLSDVFIHDFENLLPAAPVLEGLRFHRATDSERLLNVATFVIDVSKDEDALFSAMSSDYRRKVRKAEASGVKVEVTDNPSPSLFANFADAYASFATQRGLAPFHPEIVQRMYSQGNALLLTAARGDEVTNYLHLYTSGDTALFMHGVNLAKENDGAGQFLHWQAIRELAKRGFTWYDLGGVATVDPANGIYNFKQKFGGELVLLGSEWRHIGAALRPLLSAASIRRKLLHRFAGH